jgi:hypothetical protein
MSRTLLFTAVLLICACFPVSAGAASQAPAGEAQAREARTVRLTAAFSPKRLGKGTTIHFGLRIATPTGHAPSPVTGLQLLLPAGLGIASSDLGLESCTPWKLEYEGLAGCPPNSLMGRGSATAEVPFGSAFVTEQAPITLFSGPLKDGHPQLLFFASGEFPVLANIIFAALVLPAKAPFGGLLNTTPPLVPSVPEGPDVALVRLVTTIGPSGITYHERVKGRTVSFHPRGILLPKICPRGGFAFAVRLSFQDATHASAGIAVPCPRRG